ncbi:uncharacterized protein LOC127845722 [Dreissena polymorpha]|nr:uncharacterized protein LOC127845722 [Dreissena polymorpha]XP_052232781.1 uncharacterized protein LOC127845722 [Dreissena polymorpha]XP_052232782.1 uncharacterized protein LOC127845722 [Dreissena polymorpha]
MIQNELFFFCEPCGIQHKTAPASTFCPSCENEMLCDICSAIHRSLPITKSHDLEDISEHPANKRSGAILPCSLCLLQNLETEANFECQQCEANLCDSCINQHRAQKATRSHKIMPINGAIKQEPIHAINQNEMSAKQTTHLAKGALQLKTPGRPTALEVTSDSIMLSWTKPSFFEEGDYFQICYKDVMQGAKWKVYTGEFTECTQVLTDVRSNTEFVFRLRVVCNDGEGPYSEESDVIKTHVSTASRLVGFSVRLGAEAVSPIRYALPMCEVKGARNGKAKTRKFEVGSPKDANWQEKTILMIGETGTGKSTLVDGLANFILGVTWNDNFRFTIVNLEEEEQQKIKNQALSQTEWITCYTIHPQDGSRLPYTINIIDTPGFGDTRGIERDQEIVEQIRELFSAKPPMGVLYIDAVCFLLKAPDARLTPIQSYIFQSIMSLFGNDIESNICSLITFADGMDPPVFAALDESGLPFGEKFTFNNSGLFAKNTDLSQTCLSPMFWDMGLVSFRKFFKHIDTLATKSLQLTSDVLYERCRLEATIRNLQPKLDVGLNKINELKAKIKFFEDNRSIIADNKDFTYVVMTTKHMKRDLPRGRHVTNCTHCNFTCHENCKYANDVDKINCWAMTKGFCRICPEKCIWNLHANTPYIFEFLLVEEFKTYAEKKHKYEEASGKLLSQEQVLEKMVEELDEMVDTIEDMMIVVRNCNTRLGKIALRPNPLSMVEHIDLMIENEKLQKKKGWYERVQTLYRFRKRAQVADEAEMFHKEAQNLGVTGKRRKDKRTVFQRFRDLFGF